MTALIRRFILFSVVGVLVLSTLWIALMLLTGLIGLHAGMETRIWTVWAALALAASILGLAFSKNLARWSLGVRAPHPSEAWIVKAVAALAKDAGLKRGPAVGVYESFEINAFATGPAKNHALITVSTGLLERLDRDSIEGILAHEIAHAANGDMVTMTLLQGLINATALIPARLIARAVSSPRNPKERGAVYLLAYKSLQILLCPLGTLAVNAYSRTREFRADAQGARLAGVQKMRAGLASLRDVYGDVDDTHQALAIMKISGRSARTLAALLLTHPSLEERIKRLPT